MTGDDVRTLLHRMYEAFNAREVEKADEIFSSDFFSHPMNASGPQCVKKSWTAMLSAFPDVEVVVEDMLIDGTRAAVRSTLRGVPTPTGAEPEPTMMEIIRVEEGRIAEVWGVSTLKRA